MSLEGHLKRYYAKIGSTYRFHIDNIKIALEEIESLGSKYQFKFEKDPQARELLYKALSRLYYSITHMSRHHDFILNVLPKYESFKRLSREDKNVYKQISAVMKGTHELFKVLELSLIHI